jgi:SAM-dependent methyltransferase
MARDHGSSPVHPGPIEWWSAGVRQITWSLLGDAHGVVLDVGCGTGVDLIRLPPDAWGVGLDRVAQHVVIRPFVQADAGRLPFRAGSMDLILALDLLEQKNVDPEVVLSEIRRVAKSGGWMLARVPAHPELYGPHDHAWGGARRYRKTELKVLVEGAGFTIRRLTYANSLLFPLAAVVRLGGRAGLREDALLRLAQPFGRVLTGVLSLEARWLREHDLAIGLSLVCLAETRGVSQT